MQTPPHDEGLRWLVTMLAIPFAGGVGWLVKHLMGRRSEFVQLGLARAQTAEIRAKIRRENEAAAITGLKDLAQGLKDERDYWKREADYWKARAEKAERRPLEEELKRMPESKG
jgi:hypothetical protein